MIVAAAVGLALGVQALIVKPFQIPSASMVPTLEIGQRVLVDRVSYRFSDPEIGDIVVFKPPQGADDVGRCGVTRSHGQPCPQPVEEQDETNFIKRIVAGPGDRLSIRGGRPVVNGEVADEDFTRACGGQPSCNLKKEIVIPPDHFFMMGDNRGSSEDSRFWGPVPGDWIIGEARITYWPVDRIGFL